MKGEEIPGRRVRGWGIFHLNWSAGKVIYRQAIYTAHSRKTEKGHGCYSCAHRKEER